MKKEYLDALTYLSSFEDGLSHYNWDRTMTYKLKYGIHPGEFIRTFLEDGLIENKEVINNSNYRLNSAGHFKVKENRRYLSHWNDLILNSLELCKSFKGVIIAENRFPYYQINYCSSNIRLFVKRSEAEDKLICYFPSETEHRVNEISLSLLMIENTKLLSDLLESHLKYLSILKT